MTHPAPLPERDSGDGRRTPTVSRCICASTDGWHKQGCLRANRTGDYASWCGCGLARVPYRIGRADGLVCPVCDRA